MSSQRNKDCPCGSGKKYKKCCLNKQPAIASPTPTKGDELRLKGMRAEAMVHALAEQSFFQDWCFPNPMLPNGKELCDLLVIFDNVAVIWQVKDLKIGKDGFYKKGAVEKNLSQLAGARRQLFDLKTSIELFNARRRKELFKPAAISEIYLISSLMGEPEPVSAFMGEFKEHHVHVVTRSFADTVLNELDTIDDFVGYLRAKEKLANEVKEIIISGGEEELLACYLRDSRSFDEFTGRDIVVLEKGMWKSFVESRQCKAKKELDEISYGWDSIVNRTHEAGAEYETVARELARPNRFQRRILAKAFLEAHTIANESGKPFRRVIEFGGRTYCFLFEDDSTPDRKHRKAHLGTSCFEARGKMGTETVIGIATEVKMDPRCSFDLCLLHMPTWTEEAATKVQAIQAETGILTEGQRKNVSEDEYPAFDDEEVR